VSHNVINDIQHLETQSNQRTKVIRERRQGRQHLHKNNIKGEHFALVTLIRGRSFFFFFFSKGRKNTLNQLLAALETCGKRKTTIKSNNSQKKIIIII
jgi:hypothetical protein